jgi:hypothetical protein
MKAFPSKEAYMRSREQAVVVGIFSVDAAARLGDNDECFALAPKVTFCAPVIRTTTTQYAQTTWHLWPYKM